MAKKADGFTEKRPELWKFIKFMSWARSAPLRSLTPIISWRLCFFVVRHRRALTFLCFTLRKQRNSGRFWAPPFSAIW